MEVLGPDQRELDLDSLARNLIVIGLVYKRIESLFSSYLVLQHYVISIGKIVIKTALLDVSKKLISLTYKALRFRV